MQEKCEMYVKHCKELRERCTELEKGQPSKGQLRVTDKSKSNTRASEKTSQSVNEAAKLDVGKRVEACKQVLGETKAEVSKKTADPGKLDVPKTAKGQRGGASPRPSQNSTPVPQRRPQTSQTERK